MNIRESSSHGREELTDRYLMLPEDYSSLYLQLYQDNTGGKLRNYSTLEFTEEKIKSLLQKYPLEVTSPVRYRNNDGPWTFIRTKPLFEFWSGSQLKKVEVSQILLGTGKELITENCNGILAFTNVYGWQNQTVMWCYPGSRGSSFGIVRHRPGVVDSLNERGLTILNEMLDMMDDTAELFDNPATEPIYLENYPIKPDQDPGQKNVTVNLMAEDGLPVL